MSSVDDRIVNMQFNNKQFTQGAADSQKALEGLDRTIANTGKSGGLTTMGGAVDGISAKFSAMQVAGVAALATIVSKATTAGLSLIKSLTLDPITQGFSEYTTNLNSIQTVVANTGEEVDTVNSYMQKLNAYSDQTIYNFSEMAKNIGTFTAAGVDLNTATSAIQGIANLAALSGSNSQQASTAMYQLSQAIAAGKVGLMDWNSVVNAGMGGKVFQTALAQTAVGMGQVSASAVDLGGKMGKLTINGQAFRASISAAAGGESWLTSDILVKTLEMLDGRLSVASYRALGFSEAVAQQKVEMEQAKMAAEGYSQAQIKSMTDVAERAYDAATTVKSLPQLMQVVKESIGSMWANSFQIILGDFEQSKELWNAVGKTLVGPSGLITKMGNAWTGLLRGFVSITTGGTESGRTKFLEGMSRAFRNLGKVMGAVRDAWQSVFPPSSAKSMTNIGKAVNRLSRYLVFSKDTVADMRSIFAGFFSVLHIGFEIFKGVFLLVKNVFKAVLDNSDGASGGILSLVASVAEVITAFDKWFTAGGRVSGAMGDIGTAIGSFIGPVLAGVGAVVSAFASLASGGGGLSGLTDQFNDIQMIVEAFSSSTEAGMATLRGLFGDVAIPVEHLSEVLGGLQIKMQSILQSGGGVEGIFQNIASAAGSAIAGGLEIASGIVSGVASGIASAAPEVWSAISALAASIIETFKSVLGIHSPSTAMIDPGINVIQGIVQGIYEGFSLLGQAITAVGSFLKAAFVQLFGDMDALDFAALINSIISGGFLLALTNILNTVGGAGFFSGFADIFDQLGNSLQAFQQNLKAQALMAIGTAVALLVGSLVLLALLDPKQIVQGLTTIAIMMALLVGAMSALSKSTKGGVTLVFISGALNEMATAILILAGAIAILGNMDPETLSQGMTAVAISLALMVGAARALSGISGQLVAAGAAILVMAVAMQALAIAVFMFGKMDPDTLSQGMTAMALGLALMVGALRVLGTLGPSMALAGAAMLITAVSMQALAVAVLMFGKMDPDTLSQGLTAMAIGLALMVGSLLALGTMAPAVLTAAAAMAIMSTAMVVFAKAVGTLGAMDQQQLAQGLLAVAAGLSLLLGAAAIAQFVAPGLVALGLAVGLLGAGVFLAGAGMLMFATALSILVVLGVAAIAIMVVAIEAFIALLPSIAIQVAASFVSFIETIAAASPRVREAFGTIFENILGVITDAIPQIQKLMQALINAAITTLRNTIPRWIEMGMEVITKFLEGVANKVPRIAEAALNMIEDFLTAIDNHLGPIIDKGKDIIITFIKGIGKAAVEITDATGQMILDVLNGIDAAVVKYSEEIRDAGLRIAGHLIDGLTGGLAGNLQDKVNGIIGGIDIPNLPGPLGGRVAARGRGAVGTDVRGILARMSVYDQAANAIAAAYGLVNANVTNTADPQTIKKAYEAQSKADRQNAEAALAERLAKEAEKKAGKKGAGKGAKKAAEAARKEAEKQTRQAQRAQQEADAAAQRMVDSAEFNDADLGGKGDIMNERADALADRANQMLQKANAEAAKARELMKTNKKLGKAMMEQAKKDAKAAKDLAAKAQEAAAAAQGYYTQAVQARIKQLEDDAAAEVQKKKQDAEFEAADQAGKAKILQARAEKAQLEADLAKAEAARLIAYAKSVAASDPTAAMAALDEAEEQAAIAQEAAEAAEQAKQQAEQLLSQPGTSIGGSGAGNIGPSKSVLEDSAKAFNRYTTSLMEAEKLAAGAQTVVQYNQNVYSPTALDAATMYRHSKTLVSAQAPRFGYNPMPQPPVVPDKP